MSKSIEEFERLKQIEADAWNELNTFLDRLFPPEMAETRVALETLWHGADRASIDVNTLAAQHKDVALARTREIYESTGASPEEVAAALAVVERNFAQRETPKPVATNRRFRN